MFSQSEKTAIDAKVSGLSVGWEGSLSDILSDTWHSDRRHQAIGEDFKKAVWANEVIGIEWARLDNSPCRDIYRNT